MLDEVEVLYVGGGGGFVCWMRWRFCILDEVEVLYVG